MHSYLFSRPLSQDFVLTINCHVKYFCSSGRFLRGEHFKIQRGLDGSVVKMSISGTLIKYNVHDLEVMGLNPGRVKLGVRITFDKVILEPKLYHVIFFTCMHRKHAK